jgi:hypothetical protein
MVLSGIAVYHALSEKMSRATVFRSLSWTIRLRSDLPMIPGFFGFPEPPLMDSPLM